MQTPLFSGNNKAPLFGKTLQQIEEVVQSNKWPVYVAKQLARWMYGQHVTDFSLMTNISAQIRTHLAQHYHLEAAKPVDVQTSKDGTKKYLFPVQSKGFIEAAYIPDGDRHTLCISTQLGCRMGCRFCMTGQQGFACNLTSGEIINQIRSLPEREMLTNIVYMGMGEPLDNPDPVMDSLQVLNEQWGYAMSPRRITVSSIGILPALTEFLENGKAHLAISLHSPFREEREELMPATKKHPLEQIIKSIASYSVEKQRRISFEYIVFKNLNHSPLHVKALTRMLGGIRCRINLLRFHQIPQSPLQSPDTKQMESFRNALQEKGLRATIRTSRGEDIQAACGMLSTKNPQGNEQSVV